MCCSGGVYLFTVMDWNTASWAILIIGFAEVALVAWVYGKCKVLLIYEYTLCSFTEFCVDQVFFLGGGTMFESLDLKSGIYDY